MGSAFFSNSLLSQSSGTPRKQMRKQTGHKQQQQKHNFVSCTRTIEPATKSAGQPASEPSDQAVNHLNERGGQPASERPRT